MWRLSLAGLLLGASLGTGACGTEDVAARPVDVPVSRELDGCPESGVDRTPSRADLEDMDIRALVVCRHTSPSTGDPMSDRYRLEKAVRVAPAAATRIVQLLADGEPLSDAQCHLVDSPPPVRDLVQVTGRDGAVWSVGVPRPPCLGYQLGGGPELHSPALGGVILAALEPR